MKKFNTIFFTLLIMLLSGITAFAQPTTLEDNGSNFDPDHAQLMQANAVTPASTVNGSYTGQFVVEGSISNIYDYDWYKVYLNANSKTVLSINSRELSYSGVWDIFPVEDDKAPSRSITHIQDTSVLGPTAYYVNIPVSGYYYVRVSTTANTGDYKFTIGGCNYSVNNYSYTASSPISLTTLDDESYDSYDLRYADVPDDAVVYSILVSGSQTGRASYEERYVKLANDYSWTKTSYYSYSKDFSVSQNKKLKNTWMLKITGDVPKYVGTYSLTPRFTFSYVYAVLPR